MYGTLIINWLSKNNVQRELPAKEALHILT